MTDVVEVAWLDLDPPAESLGAITQLLTDEERARVARRATTQLRRRATVSLGRRREVAATRLAVDPADVELVVADDGHRGAAAPDGRSVSISVSTCGDVGLVAVREKGAVGVDVEDFGELPSSPAFAARVTTDAEHAALALLSDAERQPALLRLWTRKEAFLKATGEGIGAGLRLVTVPLEDGLVGAVWHPGGVEGTWRLYDLACPYSTLAASLVTSSPEPAPAPIVHVTSW